MFRSDSSTTSSGSGGGGAESAEHKSFQGEYPSLPGIDSIHSKISIFGTTNGKYRELKRIVFLKNNITRIYLITEDFFYLD